MAFGNLRHTTPILRIILTVLAVTICGLLAAALHVLTADDDHALWYDGTGVKNHMIGLVAAICTFLFSITGIITTVSGKWIPIYLRFSPWLGLGLVVFNATAAGCIIRWMWCTRYNIEYECNYDSGKVRDGARCYSVHMYQRTSYAAGCILAMTGFLHFVLFMLDCRAYQERKLSGHGEVRELTEPAPDKPEPPPAYEP